MERWAGKVALVTGAGSGIGAATATALVKSGMKVVGLDIRLDRVEKVKAKITKTTGELYPLKGDVSKIGDIESAFKWIKDKFGTIHVLINNAGILRDGPIADGDIKLFQDVINVNLVGVVACTQQALRLMKQTGVDDGHIICTNSVHGHYILTTPTSIFNVYPSTKHGITAFVETLRKELVIEKTKIKVTSVSPGAVDTDISNASAIANGRGEISEDLKEVLAATPFLKPEDIADGVVYALSTPPHVQVHELTIRPVGEPY